MCTHRLQGKLRLQAEAEPLLPIPLPSDTAQQLVDNLQVEKDDIEKKLATAQEKLESDKHKLQELQIQLSTKAFEHAAAKGNFSSVLFQMPECRDRDAAALQTLYKDLLEGPLAAFAEQAAKAQPKQQPEEPKEKPDEPMMEEPQQGHKRPPEEKPAQLTKSDIQTSLAEQFKKFGDVSADLLQEVTEAATTKLLEQQQAKRAKTEDHP